MSCGTTACFCGYAPLAGIRPKKGENWFEYAKRAITGGTTSWLRIDTNNVWDFLFSDEHKNSKAAAVKRGAWFLMHGLPNCPNFRKFETPPSFRPDWKALKEAAQ